MSAFHPYATVGSRPVADVPFAGIASASHKKFGATVPSQAVEGLPV